MWTIASYKPRSAERAARPTATEPADPVADGKASTVDHASPEASAKRDGVIRKLWPMETARVRAHLLRLDTKSRRMRFAHAVSDSFIEEYAKRITANGAIVFGWFIDDELRATAELRRIGDAWGDEAEAAFAVEPAFQGRGIATDLMGRIIRSARNRGVRHLVMTCLADNAKMQAVARHYDAQLHFEQGEVVGELVPDTASATSLLAEAFDDRVGYLMAVFDLQSRPSRAA